MTQDRRKDENRPTEALVFTDAALTAAALAHLEAEKAAACLVHAKDDVWVGVGTKDALRGLLREDTAYQSQAVPSELASLKELKALALAAEKDGQHIYTHPRDSNKWQDNASWHGAAKPEVFLKLIEQVESLSHSAATGKARPADDHLWDETIRDRDTYHEWADKLAEAISKHFGAYIGEHSNTNCPWAEALEAIESASPAAPLAGKAEPTAKIPRTAQEAIDFLSSHYESMEEAAEPDNVRFQLTAHDLVSAFRWWFDLDTAPLAAAVPAEEAYCKQCQRNVPTNEVNEAGYHCLLLHGCGHRVSGAPDVFDMVLDVVRLAHDSMDGTEENEHGLMWDKGSYEALSDAMDKLDALPDDRPGYTMGPAAKAAWAMRDLSPAEPAPIQASAEKVQGKTVWQWYVSWAETSEALKAARGCIKRYEKQSEDLRKDIARLSKPTSQGTAQSIDTDEFRELMCNLGYWAEEDEGDRDHSAKSLIEFINRHIAAQATADRDAKAEHEAGFVAGWNEALETARADVRELQNNLETFGPYGEESARVALDGALDAIDELKSQPAASHGAVEGEQNEGGEHAGS